MTERKSRTSEPAPRPRGRGARALADLLPEIGQASFKRFGFVQSAVVSRWAEIVGPRYAGVSTPESIRFPAGKRADGVLSLVVEGAHAPMMQHVAPAIVDRVNRFFGYSAIVRVAIRQGAARPPEPRRAPPSLRAIPDDLGESLRAIVDPELRECLTSLAGALAASDGPPRIGAARPQRDSE